ncbi:MAG: DUF502 domain-containing protein [Candidatus Omnitrophica bacterium]|nr:DUF502 domain-containing protein [Candidatus Omnitrophota bacterium]
MKKHFKELMIGFRNSFFAGIAVLLPLWVTVVVVRFLVVWMNRFLVNPIASIVKVSLGWTGMEPVFWTAKIVVFFAIIFAIALIGMVARTIVMKRLINFGEGILLRIPLIRNVYRAVQQLRDTFLINKRNIFQRVVLIEFPRPGIFSIGFVTAESGGGIPELQDKDLINVFVPTSPNPTTGFFLMVPRSEAKPLSMSIEDGIKLVISGGALPPSDWKK